MLNYDEYINNLFVDKQFQWLCERFKIIRIILNKASIPVTYNWQRYISEYKNGRVKLTK